MKKKAWFFPLMLAVASGCGAAGSGSVSSEMEALPTTLLPVTPYKAAITAAEGVGEYRNLAKASFERTSGTNIIYGEYRYFLKEVQSGATPVGLDDFLQHKDFVGGGIASWPNLLVVRLGGRYNVVPAVPVTAWLGFGESYFEGGFEGEYYFGSDLAGGLRVDFLDTGAAVTNLYVFARWAGKMEREQALYLEGGFRFNDGASNGLFLKGEYYLNRMLSFGGYFSTDAAQEVAGTFALRFPEGFGVSAAAGSAGGAFYMNIGGEYRF